MNEAVHQISRVVQIKFAEDTVMGLMSVISMELEDMRKQLPYADKLFLKLEWRGPSEAGTDEST